MKIRRNAIGFWSRKFGTDFKHSREALIETTTFPKPNLKASTANTNSLFLLIPIFDKRAQWQKKPNNMKMMEKESSKIKTIGPEW